MLVIFADADIINLINSIQDEILQHGPVSIHICSLNLYNYAAPPFACYEFDNIYTERDWKAKQSWLKNVLTDSNPQIIGFQEVFSMEALKQQCNNLGLNYFKCLETPQCKDDYILSHPTLAIASCFPILEAKSLYVSDSQKEKLSLPSSFQFSRPPLYARIELPRKHTISTITVHLKSKRPALTSSDSSHPEIDKLCSIYENELQRLYEAMALSILVQHIMTDNHEPTFVLGDFNGDINEAALSPLIGKFEQLPEDEGSLQLAVSPGSDKITHYHRGKGKTVDYILYAQPPGCEQPTQFATSVTDHFLNYGSDSEKLASDHALIHLKTV